MLRGDVMRLEINVAAKTDSGMYHDNLFVAVPEEREAELLSILSDWGLYSAKEHDEEFAKRTAAFDERQKNPPPPYEPSKSELQAMKADREAEVAALAAKIAEKG